MDGTIDHVIETRQGKKCITADNYGYREVKPLTNSSLIFFRCVNRDCKVTIHVNDMYTKIIRVNNMPHTHSEMSSQEISRRVVRSSLKGKARENLHEKPNKLIRKQLLATDQDIKGNLNHGDMRLFRKSMYEERKKLFPPLPTSLQAAFEQLCQFKFESDLFLTCGKNVVIITSENNLKYLCKSSGVFGDGTFSYAPKHFVQMYTLHIHENLFYLPLVFAFLVNKQEQTYDEMWGLILDLCAKNDLDLQLPTFNSDFETAAHKAVRKRFPAVYVQCCTFHLGQAWYRWLQKNCMKAYRGVDGVIRIFRPELNMIRMNRSAMRMGLPQFDCEEFIKCMSRLISIDSEWVPHSEAASLYIRPTLIGTEPTLGVSEPDSALLYVILCPVGPYFGQSAPKSVALLADPTFVRAWPGGVGDKKVGSNYGPTIQVSKTAASKGFHQVLWLYGEDHQITEAGTMNIFVLVTNDNGEKELITAPLNGLILPGITRLSILQLAKEWKQFKISERVVTMPEIKRLNEEGRLLEVFGAGTACVVSPVSAIHYLGETIKIPTLEQPNPVYGRMLETILHIQYGHVNHPWARRVD